MVMAATQSGMSAHTGRGLPSPPSRDAPIFPGPNASLARQWSWSLSPRRSSSSHFLALPPPRGPKAGRPRKTREKENGMVSPDFWISVPRFLPS